MIYQLKVNDLKISLDLKSSLKEKLNLEEYMTKDKSHYFVYTLLTNQFVDVKLSKSEQMFSYQMSVDKHVFTRYDINLNIYYQILTKDHHTYEILIDKNKKEIEEIEYVALDQMFSYIFLNLNKYTIHASAITYLDRALLFVGNTKVGKSTIASRFIQHEISKHINDDKPIIYLKNKEIYISGTPLSGINKYNSNIDHIVRHIVFLEQSNINQIVEIDNQTKIKLLYEHMIKSQKKDKINEILEFVELIIKKTHIIKYQLNNTHDAYAILSNYLKTIN